MAMTIWYALAHIVQSTALYVLLVVSLTGNEKKKRVRTNLNETVENDDTAVKTTYTGLMVIATSSVLTFGMNKTLSN